jgi:hypothetical protein
MKHPTIILLILLAALAIIISPIMAQAAPPATYNPATMTAVGSELLGDPWTDERGFVCWLTAYGQICYAPQEACRLYPWVCPTPAPNAYPGPEITSEPGNPYPGLFDAQAEQPLPTATTAPLRITRGTRGSWSK